MEDVESSMAAKGLKEGDSLGRELWLLGIEDMTKKLLHLPQTENVLFGIRYYVTPTGIK